MIGLFGLVLVGLIGQLLRIQVVDRDRYVAWGEDQRLITELLPGERGDIFDRNGEELAISLNTPIIYTDPLLVTDPAAEALVLAPVLGQDVADVEAALASPGRFVYLERQTTEAIASAVRDLDLDGVFIGEEPERFHPAGELLARGVLGFVGYDNAAWSGIESQYDAALAGVPGELISERGLNGRTIPEGERERRPAIDGADLVLTIDRALQFEVEQALAEHIVTSGARGGIIIISEPATGDIVAMASIGRDEEGNVGATADNRAVTWVYEPASVMKAVTFSAVLNEGLATPESTRLISSEIEVYDQTFSDDAIYEPKVMTATEILVRSSNTGTVVFAGELGGANLDAYLRDFGFGTETGLGFPGESAGLLADYDEWSGTDYASISLGQSIAVTPLQVLMAYNTIANQGLYVAPRLVSTIRDSSGDSVVQTSATRRVIDAATASSVTEMLTQVASQGTAQRAQVPGYDIAAKTGTARKAQESGGYRDAEGNVRHVATVAGFFPADAPAYSMIVILDEPTSEIYASRVAAPLFGELAGWTLRHFQVAPGHDVVLEPTQPRRSDQAVLPDDAGLRNPADEAAVGASEKGR
jgi:cell division protein FtsI (penicillin-binding protein 3)